MRHLNQKRGAVASDGFGLSIPSPRLESPNHMGVRLEALALSG